MGKSESLSVQLLGEPSLVVGGTTTRIGSAKERSLLALLALSEGRALSVSRLVDGLWGEDPPPSAAKTLQTYVSGLRRRLPVDALETTGGGYRLVLEPEALDAQRFEVLVAQGRASLEVEEPHQAVSNLLDAVRTWKGPALLGVSDTPVLQAAAQRLEELRREAVDLLGTARLAAGAHLEAIAELEAAVADEPLRERRWALLMTALYRAGRQAEALRAYQRLRDTLNEELGIDPSPELAALETSIILQGTELDWVPPTSLDLSPPSKVTDPDTPALRHNLPHQSTSFIGREKQIAEIVKLIDADARLITLTGPGGVGKTRLALQIASSVLDGSGDGVWLVELAAVSDPGRVSQELADALGLRINPDQSVEDRLVQYLRYKTILILFDNCEHLIDATASLVELLLRSCPEVWVLTTSREPLGIDGEHVYRVPSLSIDDPVTAVATDASATRNSEALRLFEERAVLHDPDFALDNPNVGLVASICRRLDGIPLAIELAASRTRALSIPEIEGRLDDRFQLLTGGRRTALPRHRTLRAMIDWSHDLLTNREQIAFRRLAVFVGGFEIAQAESVLSHHDIAHHEAMGLIASLVDKNLITIEPSGDRRRYRLPETIRQYAQDQLIDAGIEEATATRVAHALAYLELAEAARDAWESSSQLTWLKRFDHEIDNLKVAFEELPDEIEDDRRLRFACCTDVYLYYRSRVQESVEFLIKALDRTSERSNSAEAARALNYLGRNYFRLGNLKGAEEYIREGLSIARALGDAGLMSLSLNYLSSCLLLSGDPSAMDSARQAVEFAEISGNLFKIATAKMARARTWYYTADNRLDAIPQALEDYRDAYQGFKAHGNLADTVSALSDIATLEMEIGEIDNALSHNSEAFTIARSLDLDSDIPYVIATQAALEILCNRPQEAERLILEWMPFLERSQDVHVRPFIIFWLALASSAQGVYGRAAFLHGVADYLLSAINSVWDPTEKALREQDQKALRDRLGDEFDEKYQEGNAVKSFDKVVSLANSGW